MSTEPIDLDAIRARVEAATDGPWVGEIRPDGCAWISMPVSGGHHALAMHGWQSDADFVAHARQDIPALLAEVDRLRAVSEQILRECEDPASRREMSLGYITMLLRRGMGGAR